MSCRSTSPRFLSDPPHPHAPSEMDQTQPWSIMSAFVVIFAIIVTFSVFYNLIRRRNNQPNNHNNPDHSNPDNNSQQCHTSAAQLVEALPVIIYDKVTATFEPVCAICLREYESGERLRSMPCEHVFHCICVDRWLRESGACPVCRRVVVDHRALLMVQVESAQRCSERLMARNVRINMTRLM